MKGPALDHSSVFQLTVLDLGSFLGQWIIVLLFSSKLLIVKVASLILCPLPIMLVLLFFFFVSVNSYIAFKTLFKHHLPN